ncbi:MAG: hypothetical protein K2O35_06965 [Clostridia bacterium]|nr:hypothetical protein [Clostridia bacterium]
MAFAVRDRRAQDEYANYEQQSPEREVYIRQAGYSQQDYTINGGYNNYTYNQGYNQNYQSQPQYTGYFQTQASQYVNNGFSAPQYEYNYDYVNTQEQYQHDMQFNQNYDRGAQAKKISRERVGKKNINKDMIKIIVTVMVVALAICGLLIANQFISANQAQAEEDVQNIDSELLASVVTEEGSYVPTNVTIIPEYEYEQSTNWFDKFCDSLGLKLK